MDYVKLWTAVLTHPKWLALSDRAKTLLVQSWMYAGQAETNGHVPDSARRIIGHTPKSAVELEEHGWWHRNGSGWVLHDWTDHQVDAEDLKAQRAERRAQDAARARRYRERKRGTKEAVK